MTAYAVANRQKIRAHSGDLSDLHARVAVGALDCAIDHAGGDATRFGDEYATYLFDIATDIRMLMRAYDSLRSAGRRAPGVDGVTVENIPAALLHRELDSKVDGSLPEYPATALPAMSARSLLALRLLLDRDRSIKWNVHQRFDGAMRQFRLDMPFIDDDTLPDDEVRDALLEVVTGDAGADELHELVVALFDRRRRHAREHLGADISAGIEEYFDPEAAAPSNELDRRMRRRVLRQGLRWFAEQIRSGRYQPAHLRRVAIPKTGAGQRHLAIPTTTDKLLEKAILLTVEPFVDALLPPSIVGSRPGIGVDDVFLVLRHHYAGGAGPIMLTADIRHAFDSVRHDLLEEDLRILLPDDRLTDLVMKIVRREGRRRGEGARPGRGLGQGQPLSPLLLNVFLWQRLEKPSVLPDGVVSARYVDDLVALCPSEAAAQVVANEWKARLAACGMSLHDAPPKFRIVDLTHGMTTEYLGLVVRKGRRNLTFALPDDWPGRLRASLENLRREHGHLLRSDDADDVEEGRRYLLSSLNGWCRSVAPALMTVRNIDDFIDELHALATEHPEGDWLTRGQIKHVVMDARKHWELLLSRSPNLDLNGVSRGEQIAGLSKAE